MVPRGYNACISGTGSCAVKDERTGRLLLGARAQRVPTREEPARCPHNKGSPTLSVKADGFGRADSKCAWICTWFSQRLPEAGSKVRILRFRTEEGPEARPGPGPSASVKDTAEVGTGPGLTRLVRGAWGWGTPPGDLYESSPPRLPMWRGRHVPRHRGHLLSACAMDRPTRVPGPVAAADGPACALFSLQPGRKSELVCLRDCRGAEPKDVFSTQLPTTHVPVFGG